jgi:hypothetical protein
MNTLESIVPKARKSQNHKSRLFFTLAWIGFACQLMTGNGVAQELSIKHQGTNLVIMWSIPGVLQSADTVVGPWTELSEADSPYVLQPAGKASFYRLRVNVMKAGEPVYSIWPDGSVSIALPIRNEGDRALGNVQVLSVGLQGGSLLDPQDFPAALGEIPAGSSGIVRARFSGPATNGTPYTFTATGKYQFYGGGTNQFSATRSISFIPPASGPFTSNIPQRPIKWTVTSALTNRLFSPAKPQSSDLEFAEGALVPLGPSVAVVPPSSPQTEVSNTVVSAGEPFVNLAHDTIASNSPTGIPPDPNAAADSRTNSSGVALITYNSLIGVTTNNGLNFTTYDPKAIIDPGSPARTTIFPEDDGGFCCDQSVTYLPSSDIFVWVLQYWPQVSTSVGTGTSNRIRVAWATTQDITNDFINAWSWVDLTSGLLGIGSDWFDQPDVSFSDSFIFVSMSHGVVASGKPGGVYTNRRMMVRLSLADMLNPAATTVGLNYFEPQRNGLVKTRLIQNSRDAMRWATMDDTSHLALYEWSDSSSVIPGPTSIGVTTIGTDFVSTDPSGVQWLLASSSLTGVRGSTYTTPTGTRVYSVATDSGRQSGSGRPHPYVRVETINKVGSGAPTLSSQFDVWNPNYGFALAEMTHGRTGRANPDLALAISAGGGTLYPRYCVGFLGDFVVYYVADCNATEANYQTDSNGNIQQDSNGNNIISPRYGDYSSARLSRPAPRANFLFSTLVYDVNTPTPGREACASGTCTTVPHYVEWGRPEDF